MADLLEGEISRFRDSLFGRLLPLTLVRHGGILPCLPEASEMPNGTLQKPRLHRVRAIEDGWTRRKDESVFQRETHLVTIGRSLAGPAVTSAWPLPI